MMRPSEFAKVITQSDCEDKAEMITNFSWSMFLGGMIAGNAVTILAVILARAFLG